MSVPSGNNRADNEYHCPTASDVFKSKNYDVAAGVSAVYRRPLESMGRSNQSLERKGGEKEGAKSAGSSPPRPLPIAGFDFRPLAVVAVGSLIESNRSSSCQTVCRVPVRVSFKGFCKGDF